MDERLRQQLDLAGDHHPEYDLEPEDMLIITRVTLQAFLDHLHATSLSEGTISQALTQVILAIPIDN